MPKNLQRMYFRFRNLVDAMLGKEVALKGGWSTAGVVRVGDTVRRPVTEKSAFVHDVLRHLESRKFGGVPRFLGVDEKGREILTYISGTVPHTVRALRKEQWIAGAKLLRLMHDATVDCDLKGEHEVICHGDPSPANCVFRDDMPFGIIDFDLAHPGKREEDVGYAAWRWLYIGDGRHAPEELGAKLVDFVAAYDAAATWNPLELVLQAQRVFRAKLPKGINKWWIIKMWAHGCANWTIRNRRAISAGIVMRSRELSRHSDGQSSEHE